MDVDAANDFVIDFLNLKLHALRQGDWANLRQDLLDFLGWPTARADELTGEALSPLQGELRELARAVAAGQQMDFAVTVAKRATITVGVREQAYRLEGAPLRQSLLLVGGIAISRLGYGATRTCPACSRFFRKQGNQEYCALRCSNLIRTRRRRARIAGPKRVPRRRKRGG